MLGIRRRLSNDARLASLVRTGDEQAFTVLRNRYRPALHHYARRLLAGTGYDAAVVVDDALEQAEAGLRPRGTRPAAVGPWLFALTRNRAIDELRRNRPEAEAATEADSGGDAEDMPAPAPTPATSLRRSLRPGRRRRRLVAALSELPPNQVAALLGRELDHRSQPSLAAEIGVSDTASRMLVVRARENLAGIPATRARDCTNIRLALEDNYRRGARPTEQIREHLAGCDGCHDYREALSWMDGRLSVLSPGAGSTVLAAEARIVGGGSPVGVTAKAVAAVLIVAAIIGGAVLAVLGSSSSQEPQIRLAGPAHNLHPTKPLPHGAVMLRAVVRIPGGPRDPNSQISVSCPSGLAYVSLTNSAGKKRPKLRATSETKRGATGDLHFTVIPETLPKTSVITATILCRPVKAPNKQAGTPSTPTSSAGVSEHVCIDLAIFTTKPAGPYLTVGFRDDRVKVLGTNSTKLLVKVRAAAGTVGWAQRAQISSHGRCR